MFLPCATRQRFMFVLLPKNKQLYNLFGRSNRHQGDWFWRSLLCKIPKFGFIIVIPFGDNKNDYQAVLCFDTVHRGRLAIKTFHLHQKCLEKPVHFSTCNFRNVGYTCTIPKSAAGRAWRIDRYGCTLWFGSAQCSNQKWCGLSNQKSITISVDFWVISAVPNQIAQIPIFRGVYTKTHARENLPYSVQDSISSTFVSLALNIAGNLHHRAALTSLPHINGDCKRCDDTFDECEGCMQN